ncbi:hypothetical protein LTR66_011756 [Elasticomyces elasticus]|nr:hypothetical protein LTR66_011756 [Elasticomyces elasticus]KAK5010880.1 hypothetical protein LTR28_007176 [Elasticomyces elasticus]
MKFNALTLAVASAWMWQQAEAQTPPGTQPATGNNLGVTYNGTAKILPGLLLPPASLRNEPTVSLNRTVSGTYMVMLVDLSIAAANTTSNSTVGPLAPGLRCGGTTRLHWLQTGLVQSANGTFVSNGTAPLAVYGGPGPPATAPSPNVYTFYLFSQPANFTLPAWDAGRDIYAASAADRRNFSVTAISDVVGAPVAANYLQSQNPAAVNNSAAAQACPANGTTSATPSATPASFTGSAGKAVEVGGWVIMAGVFAGAAFAF